MSYSVEELSFNPRTTNNELSGNLEHTFCNNLRSSELQTRRKIKFVSSIDHYYSLPRLVPTNLNYPSTTTLAPNLLPMNEIESAVELQTISVNHYLPIDKTQCYADIPPFPPAYPEANEVGFSSLFSLEYSTPDYRSFGSKCFEQIGCEKSVERQNFLCLPNQQSTNEQVNPYFLPKYVHQNVSVHEQQLHNLNLDHSLQNHLNDNFDYRYHSLAQPICLASDWKLNNRLLPSPESTVLNFNSMEKTKVYFDQSRPVNDSKTIKVAAGSGIPGEKLFASNSTLEKAGSIESFKNRNLDSVPHEVPILDVFKNEIEHKSSCLTSPNSDEKNILKEEKLDFKSLKDNPVTDECRSDLICGLETISNISVKVSNKLEASWEVSETSNQSFDEFKLQKRENSSHCSVKEKTQNFSTSSIVYSDPSTILGEDYKFSPNKELKLETCTDSLMECDSTTESGMQPTDLSGKNVNSLLSNFNKTKVENSSSEPYLSDRSFLEAQLMKPNKCRICKEFMFTEKPPSQQFSVPIDSNFDVCNACNICFLQKSVLNSDSGDPENPHKCIYCGRCFKKECYLVLHIRIHTTEKPFKCGECHKAFANKLKLKLHSKTHTGDKPFVCGECDRRFVQNAHLKMHARVHLSNRSFQCDSCKKAFASRSSLTEHEKYHSPKLPFKCVTCEKSFVKKDYLDSHLRLHCNAKPFECSTCKTFFSQKSVLRQHAKNCKLVISTKDEVSPKDITSPKDEVSQGLMTLKTED